MCQLRFTRRPPPAAEDRCSVFVQAELEAHSYKWIMSERAKYDLGDWALHDWCHKHWPGFLRNCVVEHLLGITFWSELDRGDFGLLDPERSFALHLDDVVWRLRGGWENLDFGQWLASEPGLNREAIYNILERVDINDRRLTCPFARAG